jgi:hypothetical protein
MSHTYEDKTGIVFHYNSDLSGHLTIVVPPEADGEGTQIVIPAESVLRFIVRQMARWTDHEVWDLDYDGANDRLKIYLQNGNKVIEIDGEKRTEREILEFGGE